VQSYFVNFDSVGSTLVTMTASVTFERPVMAIIVLSAKIDASDPILGATGTTYPAAGSETGRGLDFVNADFVTWAGDGRSVRLTMRVAMNTDQVRILLQP
jgi:hypothetical protein